MCAPRKYRKTTRLQGNEQGFFHGVENRIEPVCSHQPKRYATSGFTAARVGSTFKTVPSSKPRANNGPDCRLPSLIDYSSLEIRWRLRWYSSLRFMAAIGKAGFTPWP
jgi:hypothetical protein